MTTIELGYNYDKLRSNLRGYYTGAKYHGALLTLDRGLEIHNGKRKNGLPEFAHQVFQAQFFRTVEANAMYPECTHIVILAHDMEEDHKITSVETGWSIQKHGYLNANLLQIVIEGLDAMNKYNPVHPDDTIGMANREAKSLREYYDEIATSPVASIAKGDDRIHNIQSMTGVFTPTKQRLYIQETREYILPMLKAARKRFPSQEPIYQNIKHVLLTQIHLIELMFESMKDGME